MKFLHDIMNRKAHIAVVFEADIIGKILITQFGLVAHP